jgi:outer membrane protein assembly factor BamD
MKLILLIFAIFAIFSCSPKNPLDLELPNETFENNQLEDFEIFEKANLLISRNELDLALIELEKLEFLFPGSEFTKKGILLSAYIVFLREDYEKTRAIAEMYRKYYPGSNDIAYANYIDAMTYFVLIKKPVYDQTFTIKALDKFNFILNAYPNSEYEIDIITKIRLLNNNIAKKKLSNAKFYYYKKKNVIAALIYLKDIYENYQTTLEIEETLFLLSKIYKNLGEKELSKNYAAILAYNFPDSIWYNEIYNLVNEIEETELKQNWYQKFNPINLLIENEYEEDFELEIIK